MNRRLLLLLLKIVGTQAVFNVLMGERYKMATKETKDVLSGKYGATVKPFNEDVRKKFSAKMQRSSPVVRQI